MNILGINGYDDWFHDPSACLIKDGNLIFFCEEERLIRKKHAVGHVPFQAVKECLRVGGIGWDEIDVLSVGWDIPLLASRLKKPLSTDAIITNLLISLDAPENFPRNRLMFVPHHEAHAWSVLCLSENQQALVVIIDGQGDTESTSVYRYRKDELHCLIKLDARFSLGYFYEAVSWFLGLGLDGTGKLMGLAAYDKNIKRSIISFEFGGDYGYSTIIPTEFTEVFDDNLDHAKSVVNNFWLPYFSTLYPKLSWKKLPTELPKIYREQLVSISEVVELASLAQNTLEQVVLNMIEKFIDTSDSTIALAGGVALNCKMNGNISQIYPDKNVVIQPASHDAGVALGAAIAASRKFDRNSISLNEFPYMGSNFSDIEIQKVLRNLQIEFDELGNISDYVAELIAQGNIIGWFQGNAEIGPRALGARSILARPDSLAIRDRINLEIKGRENWRPLSPAILDQFGNELFEAYRSTPFMLIAHKVTSIGQKMLIGTVHADGTARPQTVSSSLSPHRFFSLIESFHKITGIPGVLNTSFNLADEPIVNTPFQAVKTFQKSGLDALIIGNCILRRNPVS